MKLGSPIARHRQEGSVGMVTGPSPAWGISFGISGRAPQGLARRSVGKASIASALLGRASECGHSCCKLTRVTTTADCQLIDAAQTPASPWKNGGGSTRELACWPPGATVDAFEWRVSIADIQRDGPFSRFGGVDRVIVLMQGSGVHLYSHADNVDHPLTTPWQPYAFRGEAAIECRLLGGPSQDFNVMTRRASLSSQVTVLQESSTLAASPAGLIFNARGQWTVTDSKQTYTLRAGTGLWWSGAASQWTCTAAESQDAHPVLIAVAIRPRALRTDSLTLPSS